MKSEVAHCIQWVFIVLVILLHKSDADQRTDKCNRFKCGRSYGTCQMKCMFNGISNVTNVIFQPPSDSCYKTNLYFLYGNVYVWTTHCCVISATLCYKVTSNASVSGNYTTAKLITSNASVSGNYTTAKLSTTTEAANFLPNVTLDGFINSTDIEEFQDDTSSIENENVSSNGTVNAQAIATESQPSNVVLKVALPVGVFVLLILLAVIFFIFRRKVKDLMGQYRGTFDKRPDQSNPVYGINGPAFENTTIDTFDNLTYAMQTGQEHLQSGNFPTGGYEYSKPAPREKIGGETNETPSNTVKGSPRSNNRPEYEEVDVKEPNELYDTTYQTLSDERFNTSYNHIMESNANALITPQAKLGRSAYDNAAF